MLEIEFCVLTKIGAPPPCPNGVLGTPAFLQCVLMLLHYHMQMGGGGSGGWSLPPLLFLVEPPLFLVPQNFNLKLVLCWKLSSVSLQKLEPPPPPPNRYATDMARNCFEVKRHNICTHAVPTIHSTSIFHVTVQGFSTAYKVQ